MTIDRASVEEGARLAAEATTAEPWVVDDRYESGTHVRIWFDSQHSFTFFAHSPEFAAFIAHWNPEFAAELVRELQCLWRVEEAANGLLARCDKNLDAPHRAELRAALANPAAEGRE